MTGDIYYSDYAKCLNLYSLTVSEAEISTKDVEEFLSLAFTSDRNFMIEACSNFKEVFPHSPEFPSARSLKYLCRCKVRHCVRNVPTLPIVLSKLLIPTHVKDYLLYLCE